MDKFEKYFAKYLLPDEENEFRPHLLREKGVKIVLVFSSMLFVLSLLHANVIVKNTEFIAAVLPAVLVDLANEDRVVNHVQTLAYSEALARAAQLKADHMARNGYFAHESPAGLKPWHWFEEVGYDFVYAGENLAINFGDSGDVEEAWMASPSHRANILNGNFTEVGIATAQGMYNGRPTVFVVQMFGAPAAADVESTVASAEVQPESVSEEVAVTPAESSVAGEATSAIEEVSEAQNDVLVVIEEDEQFVVVAKTTDDSAVLHASTSSPQAETAAPGVETREAGFVSHLITQPGTMVRMVYFSLGLLVLIVLALTIVVEHRVQHPKAVLYGLFLVAVLVLLVHVNQYVMSGNIALS